LDDEQAPFIGNALKAVRAAIAEIKTGAATRSLTVLETRTFVRFGQRRDAGADMHRDPDDAITYEFALAGL